LGRLQDALAHVNRPELQSSGILASTYAMLGRHDEAMKILPRMNAAVDPYSIATVYFSLGDTDRGFEWLTKAVDQRQGFVRWLKVTPEFDAVRTDPRYAALVARLKLP
jgi:hypothetical protein